MKQRSALTPHTLLRHLGLLVDPGNLIGPNGPLACAYPRREAALAALRRQGVALLVNLHARPHDPSRLARHGMRQLHLPVADFAAPAPDQLDRGVAAIRAAVAADQGVAVHCGAGLGRTGTLLACFLVDDGLDAPSAIARVRAARPGSVETAGQVAAVAAFARRRGHDPA